MPIELDMIDINSFNEITKAQRASVGEIRVWSDGKKYQKQADGSWKPLPGQEGTLRSFRSETDFGIDYKQYKGNPKEAILYLCETKKGQVKGVWEREDVGSIDLIWGNRNQGLRHIIKKHLGKDFSSHRDMAEKIDVILRKGELSKDRNDYILTYGDYRVVLLDITVYDRNDNFNDKRFILTSYNHVISKENKKSSSSKLQSNSVDIRETALEKSLGRTTPDDSVFQHGLNPFRYKTSPVFIDSFNKEESGRSCSSDVNVIRKFENTNERNAELNIINETRTMREKGIRKAISSETAFEKEVNGSSPLQHSLEKGVTLSTFSPDSLSVPKDITILNIEQQFMDEIIEKAKKSSPIGTEKTWGSKVYINAGVG